MDWYGTVFETIDFRSFSNLWFWIALAVVWSSASHWILGIPFDMVGRARRYGGQAAEDLEVLTRINVNRILYIADEAGLLLVALASGLLTGLALLGFVYAREFAQAVFLLAFPLTLVTALNVATARAVRRDALTGAELYRRMGRHRLAVQAIGLIAIFFTALWGMYQNLAASII